MINYNSIKCLEFAPTAKTHLDIIELKTINALLSHIEASQEDLMTMISCPIHSGLTTKQRRLSFHISH